MKEKFKFLKVSSNNIPRFRSSTNFAEIWFLTTCVPKFDNYFVVEVDLRDVDINSFFVL